MKKQEFSNPDITPRTTFASRTFDFVVLGLIFYTTCSILSVHAGSDIILLSTVYSGVVLVSVRIGKQLLSSISSSLSIVLKSMLNNAAGLLIGAVIMLMLGLFMPDFAKYSVEIIIASVMAFFVLGTVSPLVRFDRHTHS